MNFAVRDMTPAGPDLSRADPGPNLANLDRLIATLEELRRAGRADRFAMIAWFSSDSDFPKYVSYPDFVWYDNLDEVPAELRSPDPASCGTAACLGGWCQLLGARSGDEMKTDPFTFASGWLGLDRRGAYDLFYGEWSSLTLGAITLTAALSHLRELRAAIRERRLP